MITHSIVRNDVASEVIQDCAEGNPIPADDILMREVGLPELVRRCGLILPNCQARDWEEEQGIVKTPASKRLPDRNRRKDHRPGRNRQMAWRTT